MNLAVAVVGSSPVQALVHRLTMYKSLVSLWFRHWALRYGLWYILHCAAGRSAVALRQVKDLPGPGLG